MELLYRHSLSVVAMRSIPHFYRPATGQPPLYRPREESPRPLRDILYLAATPASGERFCTATEWHRLACTVNCEKRVSVHTPNDTRITRRAGPCKTYFTTGRPTHAKAPMQRGLIGPVGFMRLLGCFYAAEAPLLPLFSGKLSRSSIFALRESSSIAYRRRLPQIFRVLHLLEHKLSHVGA